MVSTQFKHISQNGNVPQIFETTTQIIYAPKFGSSTRTCSPSRRWLRSSRARWPKDDTLVDPWRPPRSWPEGEGGCTKHTGEPCLGGGWATNPSSQIGWIISPKNIGVNINKNWNHYRKQGIIKNWRHQPKRNAPRFCGKWDPQINIYLHGLFDPASKIGNLMTPGKLTNYNGKLPSIWKFVSLIPKWWFFSQRNS